MAIFGKRKKDFVDLTEHYKKQQERLSEVKNQNSYQEINNSQTSESSQEVTPFGGFFDSSQVQNNSSETEVFGDTVNPDEKRRKLARRLKDMTEKIEDLSNQIYHLQQRLEVVERKLDVNRGY